MALDCHGGLHYRPVTLLSRFRFKSAPQEDNGQRASLAAVALGAVAFSSVFFGLVEACLLPTAVIEGLGYFRVVAQLAPSMAGHLVPYAALVTLSLVGLIHLSRRFQGRTGPLAGLRSGVSGLLAFYFWMVADYAFSGPRVSASPQRALYVAVLFVALQLGGVAFTWFATSRVGRGSTRLGSLAWALAFGLLLSNRLLLPDEYEVLHVFVSRVALVLSAFGALEFCRTPALSRWLVTQKLPLTVLLTAGALGGTWVLAKSETLAWPVWSESAGSRYLTHRWGDEDEEELELLTDEKLEKPVISNEREEAEARKARRAAPAPHIMVFSIDNLQADRVGAYGYRDNPTTPNIDRLAREGALFHRAYTFYPGTRMFMSSMLTGRRLFQLGRHDVPEPFQRSSLPKMLKRRDYHVLVKGVFELTAYHDFDPSDYAIDTNLRRATPEEIRKSGTIPHIPLEERFEKIDRHLAEARKGELPAFVWIHLLGPHRFRGGFVGSKKYRFGKSLGARYDATIRETESWLERLEELVERHLAGDGREVIWVIQSDHGAGMTRSSDRETGKTLYEDQVHVPLIIKGPGIAPGEYDMLVDSAVDVSATLLDLVGVEPPRGYDGVSLVPVLEGRVGNEAFVDRLIPLNAGRDVGAVHENFKFLKKGRSSSLFDLSADPGERHNLADQNPEIARALRRRVSRELKRQDAAMKEMRE